MSWKIATFLLGAAVIVLLVREFTRPEPAAARASATRDARLCEFLVR